MANRPRGRQVNITGMAKETRRRGSALDIGPVGSADGYASRKGKKRGTRSSGGLLKLLLLAAVVLLGGGGGLSALLGGGLSALLGGSAGDLLSGVPDALTTVTQNQSTVQDAGLAQLLGGLGGGSVSTGWALADNNGRLDPTVAEGARAKRTVLRGDGSDTVTLMVYMCGTDLESRYGMATADLQEMINADLTQNINLLVYTGGCSSWQNDVVSASANQIWQVKDEGLLCVEKDLKAVSMTDPDTLAGFIRWCGENYPANRNALILWDHGGGSVSGYGYDEKFVSTGSMDLAGLDAALAAGGMAFDFVGFDACLMATAENAVMLSRYADYMIASEETEPGIGWYYTRWLSALAADPALPTLQLGKAIADDFVSACAQQCAGQPTTLSVVDLAELEHTLPAALTAFSSSTCELIRDEQYAKVSHARSGSREFSSSTKIDQVDLVHLADNMDTAEGDALAQALLGAVKYNRTGDDITNAYGLSVYFPFRKASDVDEAVDTYESIGMDAEYARCIQEFAALEVSGQIATGGTASPVHTLLGTQGGSSSAIDLHQIAGTLYGALNGGNTGIIGLLPEAMDFLSGRSLSVEDTAAYLTENRFDANALVWQDGRIALPEEQWALVQSLHTNVFMRSDDGFLDLGLDTVYEFDEEGALVAPEQKTWLAIDGQPVAYYHESTVEDGRHYTITGRVPVMHNDRIAELVLAFTDEDPDGRILGVRTVYKEDETDTSAKGLVPLADGDTLDFIADYYCGGYEGTYKIGEQVTVSGAPIISDVIIPDSVCKLTYRFTDIYQQEYWTAVAP